MRCLRNRSSLLTLRSSFLACLLLLTTPLRAAGPSFTPTLASGPDGEGSSTTVMTVAGKTDLPARAILEVFVYYEGPDEAILMDQGRCEVKEGAFSIVLARTNGPPLSGTYRAEVVFSPDRQREAVLSAISPPPKTEVREVARLTVGKPEDHEGDIARERKKIRLDLDALSALAEELSTRLAAARREGFQREQYKAWHEDWAKRLDAREAENQLRPYVKILEVVGNGQARHQKLVHILHQAGEAPLSGDKPETLLVKATWALQAFRDLMGRTITDIGLEAAAGMPVLDTSAFEKLASELSDRWKEGAPDEAFLSSWRARWAEGFSAALPALAARSDRAVADLAAFGPRLTACQDSAAEAREVAALRTLLQSLSAR